MSRICSPVSLRGRLHDLLQFFQPNTTTCTVSGFQRWTRVVLTQQALHPATMDAFRRTSGGTSTSWRSTTEGSTTSRVSLRSRVSGKSTAPCWQTGASQQGFLARTRARWWSLVWACRTSSILWITQMTAPSWKLAPALCMTEQWIRPKATLSGETPDRFVMTGLLSPLVLCHLCTSPPLVDYAHRRTTHLTMWYLSNPTRALLVGYCVHVLCRYKTHVAITWNGISKGLFQPVGTQVMVLILCCAPYRVKWHALGSQHVYFEQTFPGACKQVLNSAT